MQLLDALVSSIGALTHRYEIVLHAKSGSMAFL